MCHLRTHVRALALCPVLYSPSPQHMCARVLCTAAQLHAYAGMCALCRYYRATMPARNIWPIAARECATFAHTFPPLRSATCSIRQYPQHMWARVLCTAAQLHVYAGMCALCRYCRATMLARNIWPIAGRECATFAHTFTP